MNTYAFAEVSELSAQEKEAVSDTVSGVLWEKDGYPVSSP